MMVIILPDHGTRYLGKVFSDNWMKDHGFFEEREFATAKDIIRNKNSRGDLATIPIEMSVADAITLLNQKGISQAPVIKKNQFVGSIIDSKLLHQLIENPELKDKPVSEVMDQPLPFVAMDNTLDVLSSLIDHNNKALLVRDEKDTIHIITQHDLLMAISK